MNKKSRLENSFQNTAVGIASQIISTVLGLVVRTVFIRCLNAEYLGVNGLFSNILTMLSLAEMGIGAAIVFNMYKPLVENDQLQIAKLMNLYRNAYTWIGITVAAIGLCLTPFLGSIIRDEPDIPHITLIYLLYLANTVSSYFFAYRRSVFSADQRERVIKAFNIVAIVVRSVFQIVILLVWKSFIGYLLTQIVCTFLENVMISVYADHCYPFLKQYKNERLTKGERGSIFENIKATFIYKFGSVALNGTDNIIISAVNGIASVGLLSNYTLITGSVESFLNIVNHSITGSVGNYIAKEEAETHERLLTNATFVNFLLYGIVFVGSVAVLNPFIKIWAGENYLLPTFVVLVHCFNIYFTGTLATVWTFRSTMGLFKYGKWRPLISAIINIVVSIWWGREFGLIGVLLGTTFTRAVTNLWYDPWIVYKYGLKKAPNVYYIHWLTYFLIVIIDTIGIIALHRFVPCEGLIAILLYGISAVAVFCVSVFVVFHNSNEFKYTMSIIQRVCQKINMGGHSR